MPRLSRLLALVAGCLAAAPAAAQTDYAWTGVVDNSWTTLGNFAEFPFAANPINNPPGATNRVYFANQASSNITTNLNLAFSIRGLVIGNVPGTVGANPVTVASGTGTNALTLGDTGVVMSGAGAADATQDVTVSAQVVVGADQPWRAVAGRTITLSGAVSSTAVRVVTVNLNAAGTAGTTGTVSLGASNAFFGGSSLRVRNGTLQITNTGAVTGLTGAAGVTLDPLDSDANTGTTDRATLALSGIGTTTSGVPLTLTAPGAGLTSTLQATTGTTNRWDGSIILTGAGTVPLEFVANNGATLILGGAVSSAAARSITVNQNAAGTAGTTGTVALLNASNSFGGSSLTARNGLVRLDNVAAVTGLTGGLTLNTLDSDANTGTVDRAILALNNIGATPSNVPLAMNAGGTGLRTTLRATGGTGNTWAGGVTLTGAAAGLMELDAAGGSTLTVSGAIAGAGYTGPVLVRGSGAGATGLLTNTVTLGGTLVKTDNASTWTITSTGNSWVTTQISTGILRVGALNALPTTAPVVLGQSNGTAGERLGTLDLNGFDQTVGGLSIGTVAAEGTDPAGNLVGIGVQTGPGPFASTFTVNRTGGAQTFNGVIVNSSGGSSTGKTVSFSLTAGDLTFGAANTYSGGTSVSGATSVLRLSTVTGGAFTNHGSVASSPTVTLRTTGSQLVVSGLTGGLNYDSGTSRFAPVANQTVQGIGTVGGSVTVPALASLRGGDPLAGGAPTGTLTVNGNVRLQGGAPGSGGGQYVVDLNNTAVGSVNVGRLAVTGGSNAVDFVTAGGPVRIAVKNDGSLPLDVPVTFVIGSAAGGYTLNGGSPVGAYTVGTDFVLTTDRINPNPQTGEYFSNVTLTSSGSNPATLTLGFTPVPEPATVLGLAAVGLAGLRRLRRAV